MLYRLAKQTALASAEKVITPRRMLRRTIMDVPLLLIFPATGSDRLAMALTFPDVFHFISFPHLFQTSNENCNNSNCPK
jgi:hypothetical protein